MNIGALLSGLIQLASLAFSVWTKAKNDGSVEDIVSTALAAFQKAVGLAQELRAQLAEGSCHVPEIAELDAMIAELKALPDLGPTKG